MEFKGVEIRKYTDKKVTESIWIFNPDKKKADETEKLISCAPELLGSLKTITDYLEDTLNEHGCESSERRSAICLVNELIKKATE